MGALPDLTDVYDGTIASVDMNTSAWMWTNPRVLLNPPPRRGSNVTIGRADGDLPRPRRGGPLEVSLLMLFIGDVDKNGAPNADPREGLIDNLDEFTASVYDATPGSDHCVALTIEPPGGGTRTGRCQLVGFEWGDADTAVGLTICRAVLRVVLPSGRLGSTGSS